MVNIHCYMEQLTELLKETFDSRLIYVGLQGSYLRGEANENSDIDIMVVIDTLSVDDLTQYRSVIQSLDNFDKSCGFICGSDDLSRWNPLEICHVIHSTQDYFGELKNLVPTYTQEDIRNFIKLSINNLYHEICHRYIHASSNQDINKLSASYKSVFFILQNLYYLQNGQFILTKNELLSALDERNRVILKRSIDLNSKTTHDFFESFELLLVWCQETVKGLT